MTISEISNLVAFEVTNILIHIWIENLTYNSVKVTNEAELCEFINIFGDAAIVSIQGDTDGVICNILFKQLNRKDLDLKIYEYIHRVYI